MRLSFRKGFSFGLTSGVITTLGLIVGLHSGTHSKLVVTGGILVIAVADALSDALGMHISEESENKHSTREIWESTFVTFFSKFIFASIFIIPVLCFQLSTAIIISIVWGLFLITILSLSLAKQQGVSPRKVILEHLIITVSVVLIAHWIGDLVSATFA